MYKNDKILPLYKIIYEELRSKILSGQIPQDSLLPGENVIAKEKSVSRITVRSALNVLCKDGLITSIPGLGHRVNKFNYIQKDKRPILFIGRRDGITPILFETIHAEAIKNEMNCRMKSYFNCFDTGIIDFNDDFISEINHSEYSGIIFFSDKAPGKNFMTFLKKNKIAILFIGYPVDGFDSVLSDHIAGMKTMCDELYARGHRKFIYISDKYLEDNIESFKLRTETFSDYMIKSSLEFYIFKVLYNSPQYTVNKIHLERIFNLISSGFDCIIASNAILAENLRKLLILEGYKCPENLSLASFTSNDNYYQENGKLCKIGGMEERWEEIGHIAFERLLSKKQETNKGAIKTLVAMQFNEGDTIKKQEK